MDPRAAAILILKKRGEKDDAEGDSESEAPSGKEALASMFDALKSGDTDAAYDAFHAAVQSCMNEEKEGSEGEGY